jgi:FkbM family methyltransferase
MRSFIYWLLSPTFGKKWFARIYQVLKNISFLGLNYRNTNINNNGELFILKKMKQYYGDKPGKLVLFDVGANIGNYSKDLYQVFGDKSSIYAFEPFSHPYKSLELLKDVIPQFQPFKSGFSDKDQTLTIYTNKEFSEVGGLYNRDFSQFDIYLKESEDCFFDRIDHFAEVHSLSHINLLKIDVEGHELFVLKGAEKLLDNNAIDFIQFEFGTANYLSKTYLYDFFQLLSSKYRMYKLLANGLLEIKEYNPDIEIHVLSNYFAINKGINFK